MPIGEPIAETVTQSTSGMDGLLYFIMLFFFIGIIMSMLVFYLIIRIWGNPILKAASSRKSGDAIIQHFQNSKIGTFLLAQISCGAIRHKKISDGTLITIANGINNLEGHSFINSWNLIGISIPTFLMGGISKLRQIDVLTSNQLTDIVEKIPENRFKNIITESYDFNDFEGIIKKCHDPNYINLEIEHTGDFIESVNQHYTESEITKEVQSYIMKFKDGFAGIIMITAIAIFIVAIAMYVLLGSIK